MDLVFKALSDPTRRQLLDELYARDGQTQGELERKFPISRFGVMKHLGVLEDAGLIVVRRSGREKHHHLNAVPIRLIHDRWVSKFAAPWVSALTDMKERLEKEMEKVYEIYIKTTPERLWAAITDPEIRRTYNFGAAAVSEWKKGSPVDLKVPGMDMHLGEGEILEIDPPNLLVHTMKALWSDEVKAEGFSRVRWEISQVEDSCRLLLTHDELREDGNSEIFGGWPMILSGLKTWLETGEALTTPGSLRWA